MEKALAAGTPQDLLDRASSPEFLQACLRRAKLDDDLVADTCDACDMNELDALALGGGDLSDADAADKLFLMQDEAVSILAICKRECLRIGVDFGDGSVYEAGPEDEYDTEPTQVPTPANRQPAEQPVHQNGYATSPPEPSSTLSAAVHHTIEPEDLPNGDYMESDDHLSDHDDPVNCHFLVKPPSHLPLDSQKPRKPSASSRSSPAISKSTSTSTPSAAKANVTPSSARRPVSAAPKPAAAKAAPKSSTRTPLTNGSAASPAASGKPMAFGSSLSSTKPRAASATPTSKPLPSYARSTASMKARVEDPSPTTPLAEASSCTENGLPPLQHSVSPTKAIPAKKPIKKSVFANISSSLLRPTKAFLAWTNKKKEEEDSSAHGHGMNGVNPVLKSSTKGPIGTGSRTFSPAAKKERSLHEIKAARSAGKALNSEEQELLKAHEETGGGFKARPMPKKLVRTPSTASSNGYNLSASVNLPASAKPRAGSVRASTPEPFKLASDERHRKAQEELARKIEEKRRLEESLNKPFKASPVPGRKQPTTPAPT